MVEVETEAQVPASIRAFTLTANAEVPPVELVVVVAVFCAAEVVVVVGANVVVGTGDFVVVAGGEDVEGPRGQSLAGGGAPGGGRGAPGGGQHPGVGR